MTRTEICKTFDTLADETGIPYEQLIRLKVSELRPVFEFAQIKIRLRIEATAKGRAILQEGRKRRLELLQKRVAKLSPADRAKLDAAAALILRLAADSP